MNSIFSTNLLYLRKERGLSQKQVAKELGVSQALLSHYEKGIRECGLDFVVKVAEYYEVTSDFLLGVSQRVNAPKEVSTKTEQEKMISSAINIVFVILKKINSKKLLFEVVNYLSAAVYTILRHITAQNELYTVDKEIYSALASSNMTMNKAKIKMILKEEQLADKLPKIYEHDKVRELKVLVNTAEKKMKEEN